MQKKNYTAEYFENANKALSMPEQKTLRWWEKNAKSYYSVDSMGGYAGKDDWIESLINFIKNVEDQAVQKERELIEWATGDDTGSSSKYLCRFMLGLVKTSIEERSPYDADDRGRCIRLLNLKPEWWNRLDELSNYPGWKEQIPLIRKEALNPQPKGTNG